MCSTILANIMCVQINCSVRYTLVQAWNHGVGLACSL